MIILLKLESCTIILLILESSTIILLILESTLYDNTDISVKLAGGHLWSEQTRLQSRKGSLGLFIIG